MDFDGFDACRILFGVDFLGVAISEAVGVAVLLGGVDFIVFGV